MALIRRLADSCVTVTTGAGVTLIDPGFSTFDSGDIDLATIGDVSRVLVTHEHSDHVQPEFVRWLIDRRTAVTVHSNRSVASMLGGHGIEVVTDDPVGVTSEDVLHGMTPLGTAPPNRSYTVEGLLTHPGDSHEPKVSAPVLALPLLAPWTSTTAAVAFARRLRPRFVIPIHDFYLDTAGRGFLASMAAAALKADGIEVLALGWGESIEI
jgi:L-ascorbate metabolism protein UlaG (beta-lactamase superfamily)